VLTDLAILPAHLLDTIPHQRLRQAAWEQDPIGNGPFAFVSHAPNRRWVFEARRDFPPDLGGPPRIDRLVIAIVDEPTTKLAALTSGELDFAGIQPAHAQFVTRDPRLAVLRYPLLLTYVLAFNTRQPPFDRADVRQAVSLAIDRRAIVDGYLFGFGQPSVSPAAPLARNDAADPSAPAAARALLGNRRVSFELLTVGSGEGALEQLIQSQLQRVGIVVHIRQLELATFLARVQGDQHDFQAAVLGVSGTPELGQLAPLLDLTGLPHDTGTTAMLRTFHDSMPVAVLYRADGLQGMNRRVHGVHMDARGELATVRRWYIAP
jgi:peptide/nickel transport system substrate-binding protein